MSPKRAALSISTLVLLATLFLITPHAAAEVYELRTYTTNEGKLPNLNARFRDHTVRIFEKHGMESVGYWVPKDEARAANTLIYILKHKSREAAAASWKAFLADRKWQQVAKESQLDGQILAKRPDSIFMTATDYSPEFKSDHDNQDADFELRIYRCNEGKLPNLDARFRDHTIRLFKRHGIESVGYWHPIAEPDSKDTLIYMIKFKDGDAAQTSWKAFLTDPEWQQVAKESQKDGRFFRARAESTHMQATDYSAIN